jgi:rhodanese-related sulfurtransferase
MERNLWTLSLGILIVFILIMIQYSLSSPWRVDASVAKDMIKAGAVVIDVRTDVERDTLGHYPNDIHIPAANLETEFVAKFTDKLQPFVLYCNTGQRARKATETLHRLGYVNSRYIAGGYWSLLE